MSRIKDKARFDLQQRSRGHATTVRQLNDVHAAEYAKASSTIAMLRATIASIEARAKVRRPGRPKA